ncbi:hypothetical protein LMG26689_02627 [Achromobacter animicus]|nr:hypothetical protein LMG26689_02627 [Achromobacter animicus]
MSEELALKLNDFTTKGYVIAPAGYGKTHLIAMAVKVATKRQLILTHTFAGVNSIKTKMTELTRISRTVWLGHIGLDLGRGFIA